MAPNARKTVRLAVLIDVENIGAKYIEPLLGEVAKFGTATARRIYGDWTQPEHARWRNLLNIHALIPVQQFRLSAGKNSTDCALIIDAMDLLYSGHFDGFCITSSDGDFTRLACRIRESGLLVYGFGEGKTPVSFVRSCDRFIALENLPAPAEAVRVSAPGLPAVEGDKQARGVCKLGSGTRDGSVPPNGVTAAVIGPKVAPSPEQVPASRRAMRKDQVLTDLVKSAYTSVAGEDGWAHLASFGAQMLKLSPSFDPRTFGCGKLGDFVVAIDLFEIKRVPSPKNPLSKTWYIKAR